MSSVVIVSPPDVPDALLLFTEEETRQILRFFWPSRSPEINELDVTSNVRRFAQQILIAGIDSSYTLGFVRMLMGMLSPQRVFTGLLVMGGKLSMHYVKHWWKHATRNDLKKPRIAEAVRLKIADNFRTPLELTIQNANARPFLAPFQMVATPTIYWGGA